jgi:hypothetical protein
MAAIAKKMLNIVVDKLTEHRRDVTPVLILTGHSAGGGVASLLYELLLHTPELSGFRQGKRGMMMNRIVIFRS